MKNYLDLMRHTLDHGVSKFNERTGKGTVALFAPQLRYDLKQGFPLATTSKKSLKAIIRELLMFIKGETNNQYLEEVGVGIWRQWALTEDVTRTVALEPHERARLYAQKVGIEAKDAIDKLNNMDFKVKCHEQSITSYPREKPQSAADLLKLEGIPTHREEVLKAKGELGPIYGALWRSWPNPDGSTTDQLKELLENLAKSPNSRRHVITSWNPSVLPDESKSPQENVKAGKQALAACHTMFQFVVHPISREERMALWTKRFFPNLVDSDDAEARSTVELLNVFDEAKRLRVEAFVRTVQGEAFEPRSQEYFGLCKTIDAALDEAVIPANRLNCAMFQRSADAPLGVPYNIASYAIFTMMLAQQFNFDLGELAITFGDFHIYDDQIKDVREQLTREPHPLPTLLLNPERTSIFDFQMDDFKLVNYQAHPRLKYGDIAV